MCPFSIRLNAFIVLSRLSLVSDISMPLGINSSPCLESIPDCTLRWCLSVLTRSPALGRHSSGVITVCKYRKRERGDIVTQRTILQCVRGVTWSLHIFSWPWGFQGASCYSWSCSVWSIIRTAQALQSYASVLCVVTDECTRIARESREIRLVEFTHGGKGSLAFQNSVLWRTSKFSIFLFKCFRRQTCTINLD